MESAENRKEMGIRLIAKPLWKTIGCEQRTRKTGRAKPNREEVQFRQAKTTYELDRIKARLNKTSES